ncbi:hypothetical protein KIPB_012982, partial [Kipferlia bialata]|eukprot:g12982.t1
MEEVYQWAHTVCGEERTVPVWLRMLSFFLGGGEAIAFSAGKSILMTSSMPTLTSLTDLSHTPDDVLGDICHVYASICQACLLSGAGVSLRNASHAGAFQFKGYLERMISSPAVTNSILVVLRSVVPYNATVESVMALGFPDVLYSSMRAHGDNTRVLTTLTESLLRVHRLLAPHVALSLGELFPSMLVKNTLDCLGDPAFCEELLETIWDNVSSEHRIPDCILQPDYVRVIIRMMGMHSGNGSIVEWGARALAGLVHQYRTTPSVIRDIAVSVFDAYAAHPEREEVCEALVLLGQCLATSDVPSCNHYYPETQYSDDVAAALFPVLVEREYARLTVTVLAMNKTKWGQMYYYGWLGLMQYGYWHQAHAE